MSSRSLPLCCVMCHTKIQRVKNNHRANHAVRFFYTFFTLIPMTTHLINLMMTRGGHGRQRSFPSSVSGYQLPALSKSQSHYSVHSGEHHHHGDHWESHDDQDGNACHVDQDEDGDDCDDKISKNPICPQRHPAAPPDLCARRLLWGRSILRNIYDIWYDI